MYQTEPEPGLERPPGVPAARKSARRFELDQRPACMCAASTRITIAGASAAMPAGAMTTCCPISRRPRTSSAAPTNITAPAGRCRCPTGGITDPLSEAFVVAAAETGIPTNPDFNGATPGRRGIFPDHDPARPPRQHGVLLSPPGEERAAICMSRLRRWRSASCSKGAAPGRSNTSRKAACARRGRARKSWSPAARITRRNCCSSPASDRPTC